MPESRDRLTRPVDVTARFLRRRLVNGGGIAILIDEPEAVVGTPFRWGATPMTDPHRHVAALALRGGGSAGRGGSRTPRATVGRGQSSHRRPSASVLPSWYPRTPLRDITAVVRGKNYAERVTFEYYHRERTMQKGLCCSMMMSPFDGAPEEFDQTIFPVHKDRTIGPIEILSTQMVKEQQRKRSFTDTSNFTLCCGVCQAGIIGQKEAVEHAKETGHVNFQEYRLRELGRLAALPVFVRFHDWF